MDLAEDKMGVLSVWYFKMAYFVRPKKWDSPKWGFDIAMNPVGFQAHVRRMALPKWSIWVHLFYSVLYCVQRL